MSRNVLFFVGFWLASTLLGAEGPGQKINSYALKKDASSGPTDAAIGVTAGTVAGLCNLGFDISAWKKRASECGGTYEECESCLP